MHHRPRKLSKRLERLMHVWRTLKNVDIMIRRVRSQEMLNRNRGDSEGTNMNRILIRKKYSTCFSEVDSSNNPRREDTDNKAVSIIGLVRVEPKGRPIKTAKRRIPSRWCSDNSRHYFSLYFCPSWQTWARARHPLVTKIGTTTSRTISSLSSKVILIHTKLLRVIWTRSTLSISIRYMISKEVWTEKSRPMIELNKKLFVA